VTREVLALEVLGKKFFDGPVLEVPLRLFKILPRREVLLLSYLAKKSRQMGEETKEGWFDLPSDKLEQFLDMKPHTVTLSLKVLKKRGYVESRKKGFPARLQVRLLWGEIKKARA
jgi:hypothetical protein